MESSETAQSPAPAPGPASGFRNLLSRLRRNNPLILSALAVVIGVAAGGAAILFRYAIDLTQRATFGFGGERVATYASELAWWHIVLVPTAGGLAIGLFVYRFMPNRRPQGVPDVIEASAFRGGRMNLPDGLKAALVSATSIGVGASVGREGPVVHLGATLGAWLAQRLNLGRGLARSLLGCGVAAAVAASFNAPIAGTIFALEVVVGHYALSAFAPIVIASVTGAIVSRMHYGDFPAFILPEHWVIVSFWEFPAFALLGVACAAAAMAFMRTVMIAEPIVARLPLPIWGRPAVAGLVIGLTALAFPQVLGVGYESMDSALQDLYPLWLLLTLMVVKILATALCVVCGFGGGVFSPSLFIGAMVGGAFGFVATEVFPELSSGHGAYTMIGMGAVTGAVLGAPFSTILIIFELTGGYALTIAVMIATVIASTITQQVHGSSFFHRVLEKRGLSLGEGQEVSLLKEARVRGITDSGFLSVEIDAPLAEVRESLKQAPWGELFVVGPAGRLAGIITLNEMGEAAFDHSQDEGRTAADVVRPETALLAEDDDIMTAVNLFNASREAHLPVVRDRKSMALVGIAHEHRALTSYHQAVIRARAEERGED
jgi:CIC family chloride channel protein